VSDWLTALDAHRTQAEDEPQPEAVDYECQPYACPACGGYGFNLGGEPCGACKGTGERHGNL
jgi:DnaJ-class molecular chaperone